MKILLLGRNGQLGWELQRSLSVLGDVLALGSEHSSNPESLCGDLRDLDALAATVRTVQPAIIVNAGAYTAVDKAQSEPELARLVNALALGVLAHEATTLGAWLVHYSSDYVFNGSGQQPWREGDTPHPLSVYGKTKLEGEQLAASTPKHLIFRTSWVYAARGGNFAKTMLRLAKERDTLSVVNDQVGAPTGAELLADVTAHALRSALQEPALAGLYHCTAAGETSWHAYARFVLDQAQAMGETLKATVQQVNPTSSAQYPSAAPRPLNSRLNTSKLQTTFGLTLPPWEQGVRRMLAEITK